MRSPSGPAAELRVACGARCLALAVAVVAMGCSPEPPERLPGALKRLGEPTGHATLGVSTRPVVGPGPNGVLRLQLPARSEGVLHLAAGGAPTSCAAWLDAGADPTRLATLAVSADAWSEAAVPVAVDLEADLRLECDDTSAVWARPHLVPTTHSQDAASPLFVLISVDTLRAASVSGFGAAETATPELLLRSREGLRFTAAASEATWTLPSHRALLFSQFPARADWPQPSSSLALELSRQGFVTLALTGGGFVNSKWGFGRGFDRYDGDPAAEKDLRGVIEREALPLVERFADAPTFLFLHTYAVHRTTTLSEVLGIQKCAPSVRGKCVRETGLQQRLGSPSWKIYFKAPGALRYYHELVREADRDLALLFEALERHAETRPVLVVLVSDHGEAFGENGQSGHGLSLPPLDPIVHIPFLVWGPGLVPAGRVSSRAVSLLDVAPSMLAAAGAEVPTAMRGANLWPLWSGVAEPAGKSWALSQSGQHWAIRSANRKLIARREDEGAWVHQLFDLERDPREAKDLAPGRPAEVAELRQVLEAKVRDLGADIDAPDMLSEVEAARGADNDLRQQLEALGYAE